MDEQFEVLTSSKFYLEIQLDGSDSRIDAYFMECQGFERTSDVIDFCQVTPQKWGTNSSTVGRIVRTKIPGNSKNGNLILRRGMTTSMVFWGWFSAVEQGQWSKKRKNGDLVLYNQASDEKARFRFFGAWPVKYKISDVKAGSAEFELEEVELAIDEFKRIK